MRDARATASEPRKLKVPNLVKKNKNKKKKKQKDEL